MYCFLPSLPNATLEMRKIKPSLNFSSASSRARGRALPARTSPTQ